MVEQTEQDMQNSTICDDLTTNLITLKVILDDKDKTNIAKDLEIKNKIKQSEAEKLYELETLEEELKIRT